MFCLSATSAGRYIRLLCSAKCARSMPCTGSMTAPSPLFFRNQLNDGREHSRFWKMESLHVDCVFCAVFEIVNPAFRTGFISERTMASSQSFCWGRDGFHICLLKTQGAISSDSISSHFAEPRLRVDSPRPKRRWRSRRGRSALCSCRAEGRARAHAGSRPCRNRSGRPAARFLYLPTAKVSPLWPLRHLPYKNGRFRDFHPTLRVRLTFEGRDVDDGRSHKARRRRMEVMRRSG